MSETLQAIDEYVSSDVKDGTCRVCGVPLFGDDGAPTDGRSHDILCPLPLLITARLALAQLQQERRELLTALAEAKERSGRATIKVDALQQERDALLKECAIRSLAVPLEEDLSSRIDEAYKHLAMEDGFTLAGLARLFVECQRRMADDWLSVGAARREAKQANEERDALREALKWQPIETAPKGYDGERFHYVLFYGVSKSRSLSHPVIVSGYMGSERRPIVNYQYALVITHWMPLPEPPAALATSQKGA